MVIAGYELYDDDLDDDDDDDDDMMMMIDGLLIDR